MTRKRFLILALILAVSVAVSVYVAGWTWCGDNPNPAADAASLAAPCHSAGLLPDRSCTPGATFRATAADVCTPGWASDHRHVGYTQRRLVFARYGIPYVQHALYEVDHLIPLELGGSNLTRNLWPEPWPAARRKDRVENRLHARVCAGVARLRTAQRRIASDWTRA